MTRSAFSWCLIPAAQNPPEVVVAQNGQKALVLLAQAGALGYGGVQVGRVNSGRRALACVPSMDLPLFCQYCAMYGAPGAGLRAEHGLPAFYEHQGIAVYIHHP